MTTRLRGYLATRLRGYAATWLRLPGYAATRLRGYVATRLRGYVAARLRGYLATRLRLPGHAATWYVAKRLRACAAAWLTPNVSLTLTLLEATVASPQLCALSVQWSVLTDAIVSAAHLRECPNFTSIGAWRRSTLPTLHKTRMQSVQFSTRCGAWAETVGWNGKKSPLSLEQAGLEGGGGGGAREGRGGGREMGGGGKGIEWEGEIGIVWGQRLAHFTP